MQNPSAIFCVMSMMSTNININIILCPSVSGAKILLFYTCSWKGSGRLISIACMGAGEARFYFLFLNKVSEAHFFSSHLLSSHISNDRSLRHMVCTWMFSVICFIQIQDEKVSHTHLFLCSDITVVITVKQ